MFPKLTTGEMRVLLESMGLQADKKYFFGQIREHLEGTFNSEKGKPLTKKRGFLTQDIGLTFLDRPPGAFVRLGPLWLQIWVSRITPIDASIWGETRIFPDGRRTQALFGLEAEYTQDDIKDLSKLMVLWKGKFGAGRPFGSNKLNDEDAPYIRTASDKYADLMEDKGEKRITQRDFAEHVGCDPKTLRPFMEKHAIPWPRIGRD